MTRDVFTFASIKYLLRYLVTAILVIPTTYLIRFLLDRDERTYTPKQSGLYER